MLRSGLIGRAIQSSRSPWLHEEEARTQGIELHYELFDFTERGWPDDRLCRLLEELQAADFAGVNVTYPFKQAVMPLLDEIADSARTVGAVNTIAMRGGKLVGHNTDMEGFRHAFLEGLPGVPTDRVLQLGAGGAGAAVASALLSTGVRTLEIADVDQRRAEALAASLAGKFGTRRARTIATDALDTSMVDGIVNTTPIGMASHPGLPLRPELIRPGTWVADVIYFPIETELLRLARDRGCAVLNGGGMVVTQAALAFEIITGHSASIERMRGSFAASA